MKKLILSIFVIASFGFYVLWQNSNNASGNLAVSTENVATKKNNSSSNVVAVTPTPTPIPTPTPVVIPPKKTGTYNDGEYTGDAVLSYNDYVQVKAIISGGKLTDIQFVQSPQGGRSGRISSFALPTLKQEAIKAQSANVNAVSGASYTSPAFTQSLSSALAQAKV